MKHYRIVKKTKKSLNVTGCGDQRKTEVQEKTWYIAEERFLWFFWFSIGHVKEDVLFLEWTIEHKASTRDEMEEYVRAWHEVFYGKREFEIDYRE
jgi:hypothetical protein